MKAAFLGFSLLVFSAVLLWSGPVHYREFVAPDSEQMDLKGPVKSVQELSYDLDEAGKRELSSEEKSTFDPQGYLLETSSLDHSSKETEQTQYTYDSLGDLTDQVEVKGSTKTSKKIRLLPDRQRMEKTIVMMGRSITVEESKYDAFKKESESITYKNDGKVEDRYNVRRDKSGKEIEVTFSDASGKVTTVITDEWDERGFIIKEVSDMKSDKALVVTTYEYPKVDSHGNWIEQIASTKVQEKVKSGGGWKELTVRTIEYY